MDYNHSWNQWSGHFVFQHITNTCMHKISDIQFLLLLLLCDEWDMAEKKNGYSRLVNYTWGMHSMHLIEILSFDAVCDGSELC